MSHGDRAGHRGQGPKTGRAMGYCLGSDSPGSLTGISAGAARDSGRGAGCSTGQGAGRGTCRDFRCRKLSGFGRSGRFAARGEYSGYYYPATVQTGVESNVEIFENRIKSLKQEFETFIESLKTPRPLEIEEKK